MPRTSSEAAAAGTPGCVLSVIRPPVELPGDGAPVVAVGLGVTGVWLAGAALGLTGEPGFAAVSAPVAGVAPALSLGDALGLLVFDSAIRLQVSKSACVGSAASAAVELTRKTPAMRTMRALTLFIRVSSFMLHEQSVCRWGLRLDGVRATETGSAIAPLPRQ